MSDKLEFLGSDQLSEANAEETPPEPAQEVVQPELGLEAEVEPKQDPAPEPKPEPAQPVEAEPEAESKPKKERDPETGKFVPPGLLEERRKRQAAEKRLHELEQQLAQPSQPEPRVTDDPDAWASHVRSEQQWFAYNQNLNTSEMLARQQFGDEPVDLAAEAFKEAREANPALQQQFDSQRHPYSWLLNWHKQHQLVTEIGDDPEAWRKAEAERIRQELLQEMTPQKGASAVAQTQAQQQQPPPSMASMPVAAKAGTVPVGPGRAFDRAIK